MSKGKLLAVCVIWLVIFAIGAVAWRLIGPKPDKVPVPGGGPYRYQVAIALDEFSGYAVLRSKEFKDLLRRERIKLELISDGADYAGRLNSLQTGEVQMAAFTVDALIKTMAESGESPATIVALIDETRGADAMVAYKSVVKNVDDLNHSDIQFVVTPDSPSETLARVVMSTFALDQIPADPFRAANGAKDVHQQYLKSKKDSREVFVLWEPYVSKILANDAMHVVIDSSRFTGYIVDCLVAEKDFMSKYPEVVNKVVECYFRALYQFNEPEKLRKLVQLDAVSDSDIDAEASKKLVQGIEWKNTQQNYAHFGLRTDSNTQYLEDMIDNITSVLLKTGAIDADPTGGAPHLVYDDGPLRKLFESDPPFHPGPGPEKPNESGSVAPLEDLTEAEWQSLQEVGTIQVPKLHFAPGRDELTEPSKRTLDDLVEQLKTWPRYYVIVRGNASLRGNLEDNKLLAERRAEATEKYLTTHGIPGQRIRAVGGEPSGETSVTFRLGQLPY